MARSESDPQSDASPTGGRCPICKAPSETEHRPFCSPRCADVDLSRWLRGAYAIAATEDDDEDGDSADAPPETPDKLDQSKPDKPWNH